MKKIFVLVFAISFSAFGFSQEEEKAEKKPERITIIKGGESKPVENNTTVKKILSPEEELASCEAQLEAINKKEAYLKNNEESYKTALENGWFKDADKNKAILIKRIKALKK